ncbi:MAG TPA: bacillithiol biosynthesis cysteine-adding enzyme BshC [Pseudogracilibacillus sp.]|nr:bacillithiol biosynthesis cysteine-adding enzyme BshC [Pseudogracilibacillus sp.]
MQTKSIQLTNKNHFISEYRNGKMMNYFDYKPFDEFERRVQDVTSKTYEREKLVNTLTTMNKNWDAPQATINQIERLKDERSVVVVGGQQAGLLTGPLYSINKLISIVRLAKEQEEKLQRPVIPVFWIAGEDHDFEEINHIYTSNDHALKKHRLQDEMYNKVSVSHLYMDQEKVTIWLQTAFADMKETMYTKSLYDTILRCLHTSESYVDFFAKLIHALFPEEGIVLIDSGDEAVRRLETDFFQLLIKNQEEISASVYETVQQLQQKGYTVPLEVEPNDTHLFYHDDYNERILLKREEDKWVGKNDEVVLTTEDMLHLAATQPDRLSNNVVTRPLMQEYLFPTLAFVGGDGEISYWAALKKAFHCVELTMPPVVPRLSLTYKTDRVDKLLRTRVLKAEDVIQYGVTDVRMRWLMSQETPSIDIVFSDVLQQIETLHEPLRAIAKDVSADLEAEAARNKQYIQHNIHYLQKKVEQKIAENHKLPLQQFDEINIALHPNNGLQERIWSPLPFINEYGVDFFKTLIHKEELSLKEQHYIVSL